MTHHDAPAVRRLAYVLVLLGVLCCPRPAAADTITLAWNSNPEPEVTGYLLYVGTQSGVYTQTIDVLNVTTYAFTSAAPGQRYYFAIRAYAPGAMSPFSGEVSEISNSYPVLTNPGNQTGPVNQAASLTLVGSDPDGAALTYSAAGLPPGLSVTANTGLVAGTPTAPGTYSVTATVSDGVLSAQQTFSWVIQSVNTPPTLVNPGAQSSTVGQVILLQLQGADANGDTLTYSASGLPPPLSVTANTGLITGTLSAAGSYSVTVGVSDGQASASQSFTWTVTNLAPTLAAVADQAGTMGQATSLQLQGSDANSDPLTYSAAGLPPGLSVTANTGLIDGTPTAAGTFNVTATVSDGTLTASRSFSWTIAAANVAPTLAAVAAQGGTVGQFTSLQLQGSDANSDPLTYSAAGLPPGLSVAVNTGLIDGTPATAGSYSVTATVSDGTFTTNRSFTWTIAATNVPPTLAAVAAQSGTVGQATSLQLQGSDDNGTLLTYSAVGLPPGLLVGAGTGLIAGTPTTAGAFNVTATVSDGTFTASRSFLWTIAAANVAPTLTAVAAQGGTVGQATSLQLQGSDANGTPLTYSAVGLPPGLAVTANTGLIAGTPTTAGTFNVTATVSDGTLTASRSFTWTIAGTNLAPGLAVVANQAGTVGQATSLQLQGSDVNGDPLTYSASGLPPGLTVTANTGLIAGTPTAAGTFSVTAIVFDGALTNTRAFTWTIAAANVAPTLVAIADQPGTVGQATSLQLQGSDANGTALMYSASGLPPGLTIAASTGLIAGTPTAAGAFNVTATVSDGALTASRSFSWTIAAASTTTPAPDGSPGSTADTRAAARHASTSAVFTGTTAATRPSGRTESAVTRAARSPGAATAGTGSSTTTAPLAYTGTSAVARSVAGSPSADAPLHTGTAMLRAGGTSVTGAMTTSSGSTTRAVVSNPLTDGTQAPPDSTTGSDAASTDTSALGSLATNEPPIAVSAAPMAAPTIGIETPVPSARLAAGSVIFSGIARDAEDGDIANRIVWISSVDGRLGTGGLLHKPLSTGTHIITASVTDGDGNTRSAQVTIRVGR